MATPNYGYAKRQRELEKKRKKEEKARAKAADKNGGHAGRDPEVEDAANDALGSTDAAGAGGEGDGGGGD